MGVSGRKGHMLTARTNLETSEQNLQQFCQIFQIYQFAEKIKTKNLPSNSLNFELFSKFSSCIA